MGLLIVKKFLHLLRPQSVIAYEVSDDEGLRKYSADLDVKIFFSKMMYSWHREINYCFLSLTPYNVSNYFDHFLRKIYANLSRFESHSKMLTIEAPVVFNQRISDFTTRNFQKCSKIFKRRAFNSARKFTKVRENSIYTICAKWAAVSL